MQYCDSRQDATGLVVNKKINVRKAHTYLQAKRAVPRGGRRASPPPGSTAPDEPRRIAKAKMERAFVSLTAPRKMDRIRQSLGQLRGWNALPALRPIR
jgi:hypothetical protein